MGVNDTWGEVVRGSVKMVFVLCYIAFMWASIHHVAVYFNNFEQGNGDMFGSYALAGAFDITALVTTIGVMFFRKSMPLWVLWIVWIFILAIAAYSFFINWEYASHYQNMDLIMQPTGATTPVYDQQGVLHYVPVMRANTGLLWINPILASGFTIFSLIYSIIAEFFGTKPPTTEELLAKKAYLEETSSLLSEIQKLEGQKSKHPSWVQRAKGLAQEVKDGAQELAGERKEKKDPQTVALKKVIDFYRQTPQLLIDEKHAASTELMIKKMLKLRKIDEAKAWRIQAAEMLKLEQAKTPVEKPKTEEVHREDQPAKMENAASDQADKNTEPIEVNMPKPGQTKTANLDEQNCVASPASTPDKTESKTSQWETKKQASQSGKNSAQGKGDEARLALAPDTLIVIKRYPAVYTSWLSQGVKSVTIDEIVTVTKQPKRRVQYQVGRALKTTTRNEGKILVASIIDWLKTAPIPEQNAGLGEGSSTGKTAELPTTGDLSKGQGNEAEKASQSDSQNGHKNGHAQGETPLDLPELEVVG
jgi:hypothetical protein